MRRVLPSVGEHYHIFNRGMQKQTIFHNVSDYVRFLFLILLLQSPRTFDQISRLVHVFVKHLVKHPVFDIDQEVIDEVVNARYVEIVSFCLMPNHFHLILKELEENGTSRYMQRVLNGYTKYYNAKYGTSGHLFQGPYKAVHVKDNDQLLHLSAYIHRNPRELSGWKNKEQKYPWSSYQDYSIENRWGTLLATEIVAEQFKTKIEYAEFVESSPTKAIVEELSDYP